MAPVSLSSSGPNLSRLYIIFCSENGIFRPSFVSSQNRVLYMYIQFVKYFYKFLSFGTYKSIVCMVNLICIGKFNLYW